MDILFGLLFLIGVPLLVIGLVMVLIKRTRKKGVIALITGGILIFLSFSIFFITIYQEDQETAKIDAQKSADYDSSYDYSSDEDSSYDDENSPTDEYSEDDDTSSEEIEDISVMDEDTLKDTLDEASSDYRYKVKSVKGVFNTEPYLVNITLDGTESLSTRLTFKSFEHDITDVLKVMKKNDYQDYEKISINVKYPMTDQYGNETDSYVIKSDFTPESIKKINFKKFYPGNLKDVANSWWVQPALKKYE